MNSLRRRDSLELCNATGRENGGPTRNSNNIMRSTRTKNSVIRGNQHSESNNDGMRFLPPPPILDERDCQSNCPSATESSDLDNSISLRRRRAKDIHVESMVSKAFETLVEKGKHNRNQFLGNNEAPFSSSEEVATTASLSMSASSSLLNLSSSMHSITQNQPRHSEETLPYLKKPHYLDKENLVTSQRSTKIRNRRQSVLSNNTLNLSKTSNNTIMMNNSVTSKPSTEHAQRKCKTKPEKKKNAIRLSDTGILGSLSALSLNTTNNKNRTVAPESQQEKQNNSIDSKNEDTVSDSEEEDSSSSSESAINYEEQSLSYYVEEEDEDGYENTTSSYQAYVDSDEDDRDDDEEYIDDESSSSNFSSDGDEDSRKRRNQIKYKPEVLWNGDILHPDGKITSAADVECSDSDSDSDSREEGENSSTNSSTDYDSSSEPEAEIKSFRSKKSKSTSKKRHQNQASKKEKKKNDEHLGKTCTTEYSTDTDHEIESEAEEENEDELSSINNTTSNDIISSPLPSYDEKPSSVSHNSPPSTSPITSKKSKKKSNNTKEVTRRKEVSPPDKQLTKKDEKRYTIPRFKLIPSPLQSKNSEDITMTSSASSTNNFESSTNKNQDFHHPSSSSTSISPLTTASTSVTTVSKHEYVKPNKWSLGTQIGSGSFGVVHVGMNTLSGNLMAVKVLKNVDVNSTTKNSTAFLKDLQSEIDLMRSLSHPNIVRYFGAQQKKSTLYIFQEWVPGGSLSSLLKKFGPFETSVIRRYLYQTLRGLEYLHSQNILHRDIKGGNILVDDRGTIKLADFGASKQMFPSSAASLGEETSFMMESMSIRGTPYFMPVSYHTMNYTLFLDTYIMLDTTYLPPNHLSTLNII